MLIKAGVEISRLNREIRRSMSRVSKILKAYGTEFIITSTFEGNHGDGSLHYANDAYDCKGPGKNRDECVKDIRLELEGDYDVADEKDHIHIEWDPKY